MAGRVLIVEDEVLIRMLAVDMLEDLGFPIDEAGTAAEALQKLKASRDYALVFLDIGLPDRKGDEVVKEVRGFNAGIPFLVASGEAKVDLQKRLDGFAPIGYLSKPYDQDKLASALKALNVK